MRLSDTRTSKRSISVTPLIDVVFLLLIFFMLVSTFIKFNAMPVATSTGGAAATDRKEVVFIQLINSRQVRVNGLLVSLDQLISDLDAKVATGITSAIVKPMPDATVQDLVSTLDRIRRSSLKNVVIAR